MRRITSLDLLATLFLMHLRNTIDLLGHTVTLLAHGQLYNYIILHLLFPFHHLDFHTFLNLKFSLGGSFFHI